MDVDAGVNFSARPASDSRTFADSCEPPVKVEAVRSAILVPYLDIRRTRTLASNLESAERSTWRLVHGVAEAINLQYGTITHRLVSLSLCCHAGLSTKEIR